MKNENILRFFEEVMTDRTLAEKLTSLAGENGYEFAVEELLELGEVSPVTDEEIDSAAGGAEETVRAVNCQLSRTMVAGGMFNPRR